MTDAISKLCVEYLEYEEHPEFVRELRELIAAEDDESLSDRFYTSLAFGTGGLRGKIGAGYNRMNPYMVNRATQGLAAYISSQNLSAPSVVIAYDSRRYSPEFAESAALVLCQNGIKAYLFSSLRPTPELSFAVRFLGATAGIVVTASHNPPEYNGYKVYWSDGGQIVPPHDSGILAEAARVAGKVLSMPKQAALDKGMLAYIDEEIDRAYLEMIDTYLLRTDSLSGAAPGYSVVYTPLHGTGALLVEAALKKIGIQCVTVPEQREPDGDFPTVTSPNPEESSALKMAVDLAKSRSADLVMATDPDSDRLGIAVRDGENYVLITGNQLGSLLCDYVFSTRKEFGKIPEQPALVKTVVTTELQRRIAEAYGAKVYDVLTGFKYIGEKIRQFEDTGEEYVFGGEESYGYLVETEVRDKDAVSTAALTAEMALYRNSIGSSLIEYLDSIYQTYGFFQESLISKSYSGEAGVRKIAGIMAQLRENPPSAIGGQKVAEIRDYQKGFADLPKSNVLQFVLESGIVSARPSGTEPKVKFYFSCWADPVPDLRASKDVVGQALEAAEADMLKLIGE